MKRIRDWFQEISRIIIHYFTGLRIGFRYRETFRKIHTYCIFIGYPGSGHSLIGSLLDAHPHAVIAHELDSLQYVMDGFSQKEIFALLIKNSQQFTEVGRKWMGYEYAVPNQWNGRFSEVRVIGDKKGHGSTLKLKGGVEVLRRLRRTVKLPVKVIHVIRNPYDNITAIHFKSFRKPEQLPKSIDYYFSLCDTIQAVKQQIPQNDFFEMRHEDFVSDPKRHLKDLCLFLNIEPFEDYLNDCAGIVFKSPHETRHTFEWQPAWIQEVARRMNVIPYLRGYEYASCHRSLAGTKK